MSVETEPTETRELLERAQAGDDEAYGELCRVHATRLLRQAVALCGNEALAEDLAQDTLVEAWKYLRRFNHRCQFFTWLCTILLNRYRNVLRANRRRPVTALGASDQEAFEQSRGNLPDDNALPDQVIEQREQAALVQKYVRTLPDKQQQVIYLRFYVDDSLESIAAALGCSVGTVKSRLFHAVDNLRKMNAFHGSLTDFKPKDWML